MMPNLTLFISVLLLCFAFSTIQAQPKESKLDGLADYGATYPIQLDKDAEHEDMEVGYFEGALDNGRLRLTYTGLQALQPVAITLIPKNPEDKLVFKILKAHWEDVVRIKENVEEVAQFVFRTKGDFGVEITSETLSAAFYVMVWVGKEVNMNQHKLFFPAKQFKGSNNHVQTSSSELNDNNDSEGDGGAANTDGGSASKWTTKLIAIALLGIFVMLLLFFLRGNTRTTIQVVLIVFIGSTFYAQEDFSSRRISWTAVHKDDIPTPWQDGKDSYDYFMELSDLIKTFNEVFEDGVELKKALEGLIEADDNYIPEYDPRGMPQLPSSCMESVYKTKNPRTGGSSGRTGFQEDNPNDACKCLEKAYENFYEAQWIFEYMRIKSAETYTNANFKMGLGDAGSSIHGASAVVWQTQKVKILEALKNFDKSYDNGYDMWIDKLYNILMEIDTCESKAGFDGWYRRAGFIYYEFMKLKYKRN